MLYRAFATVGGLTMISRLLGFARDILIAAALGSGVVADAFFVAFRFPNLFRRLFGEGAFNAAFVPLFARRLEGEGEGEARRFAEEALSVLAATLIVFSLIMIVTMPWMMLILAPGFIADPAKYDLAVLLSQIAFPYLLCMSLVALLSGVMNSLNRFWAAAAAPILLNVILIAAISLAIWLGFGQRFGAGIILSVGVAVAGIAQLAMLWIAVRRAGLKLKLRWPRYTPGVKRLVELGIPGVVAGGITQINIVVGTVIASLQAGAVSYLYYADRLYQLPLGIVGVAIGVVLLPDLARKLRAGDQKSAMDSQNRSLEFALLLTLPAAVALTVAAEPIVRVLFERGAFSAIDTDSTAQALAAFALGLPAFVMIKVFQPAFFAREDTATPMRFAAINMVINVVGSLTLFYVFQSLGRPPHVGIALATSIAGWVNALMLWGALVRSGDFLSDRRLVRNLPLIAMSSAAMGAAIWFAVPPLAPYMASATALPVQAGALAVLVALGGIVFFAIIFATGVFSVRQLARLRG
ncbi:MAG: murein biosynthesis integral membrane protein MurJ [Alphaproteobacteria bacterium]|nr:murein biosynthesis integral membrane protein MurJ [Alphaproteobacteria bacterium]